MSAANSLPSSLPPSFVQALLPSFLLVFLFAGKVRGSESECVSATVIIAIVSPSLPLSLSPLSHCPPLPFSGIRGTNVIHSPARRRSRSLRPNGQLCKSLVPPPAHPPVDYKHTYIFAATAADHLFSSSPICKEGRRRGWPFANLETPCFASSGFASHPLLLR